MAKMIRVWVDIDGTLNTLGAFGYPFNPVPASELVRMFASRRGKVIAIPLTARIGLEWTLLFQPSFQPLESGNVLHKTMGTRSSGNELAMARGKILVMRRFDSSTSKHVIIDNNPAFRQLPLTGSPPIIHIKPAAWNWPQTQRDIIKAIDG